jgi:hypothetical protein
MAGMDFFDFASMIEDGAEHTELVEYRDARGAADRLRAGGPTD